VSDEAVDTHESTLKHALTSENNDWFKKVLLGLREFIQVESVFSCVFSRHHWSETAPSCFSWVSWVVQTRVIDFNCVLARLRLWKWCSGLDLIRGFVPASGLVPA
jgi:hypothetical protein